ncbi:MAG TPA: hypothetical protein VFH66_08985 [Mycobacteriales bacterium]|nr:hypothetical protein [Mycobacteriales bacterium]
MFRLSAVAVTALAASLNAPTVSAATPPPLTSVVVTGYATTPLSVIMSWTPSGQLTDPSVRLVVVSGTVPTTDPNDPAALNIQDVAPAASATPVTGLTGGAKYAVSAFAYDAADDPRTYATPATATWTEPSPVTSLTAVGQDQAGGGGYSAGGTIIVDYTLPADADSATVCALEGTSPPTAPTAPALCAQGYQVEVMAGHTYTVAVFSWSSTLKGFGPASTTGPITVPDNPPPGVLDFPHSTARTAHSVVLWWGIDSEEPVRDLASWVITRAAGTAPPPLTATPLAVIPASPTPTVVRYIATGLVTDRPYTFTVRARDLGGHLSWPSSATVAARVAGQYVRDNNRAGNVWSKTALTCTAPLPGLVMTVTPRGVTHAAYLCGGGTTPTVWYAWRSPTRAWSRPVQLGRTSEQYIWGGYGGGGSGGLSISVSPAGHIVVGWNGRDGRPRWRDRWPAHAWGTMRLVPVTGRLAGLVQDSRSRIHLLVTGFTSATYRTNVTGSWTQSALPGRDLENAVLAVDRATGRIAVALQYSTWVPTPNPHDVVSLRIGSKPPATRSFPPLYRRSLGAHDSLLGLASAGGRVMIAIDRGGSSRMRGIYLMTGKSIGTLGSPRRVSYTGRHDHGLMVSMPSPSLAVLTWIRHDPSWATAKIGVFTAYRRFSPATDSWASSAPVQRSRSWYDLPAGAYRDRYGHLFVAFTRVTDAP